jgi:predicted nuclease of predicted toxin-antitoxin system
MKFLANENFPLTSIKLLRNAGYDVISASEEMAGEKDSVILSRAAKDNLIILTFDRDYGDLIYRLRLAVPFGVVYFRFDPNTPSEPYERMLALFKIEGLSFEGKFTVTDRQRIRQRPLPSEK